jgi:hypothetical protein
MQGGLGVSQLPSDHSHQGLIDLSANVNSERVKTEANAWAGTLGDRSVCSVVMIRSLSAYQSVGLCIKNRFWLPLQCSSASR